TTPTGAGTWTCLTTSSLLNSGAKSRTGAADLARCSPFQRHSSCVSSPRRGGVTYEQTSRFWVGGGGCCGRRWLLGRVQDTGSARRDSVDRPVGRPGRAADRDGSEHGVQWPVRIGQHELPD